VNDRIAYSIVETAHRLGVSRSFVYLELNRGKLASVKIGGRRLIRTVDADAYLAVHQQLAQAA
jgi:excisionase family DNA binding protein